MISFPCPNCGEPFRVSDALAGRKGRCRKCKAACRVPEAGAAEPGRSRRVLLWSAVAAGVLRSGILYECIQHGVDYVLAGSVRDDGPLPDTIMNLSEAQDRYAAALDGVGLVLVLSTMLHGIGVGNMLPAWVRLVCVDINPAVVTKLADRGSSQTVGIVTDVGLFLRQLASALATD